jgi:hypothetical protein
VIRWQPVLERPQHCNVKGVGVLFWAWYQGHRTTATAANYLAHYPLGKPNDDAPSEIPAAIADDFKEAIRCQWIKAFKVSVAMFGRALEASCINLGADADKKIHEQIDWLASQGKITAPLREMAHTIRLGRNRGAHPQRMAWKKLRLKMRNCF